MVDLAVPFGEETVHYAVGPASCAVPGLPGGLDALWREYGRLPWARLVEPALRLAREGTDLPARHAACLAMLEPVMTLNRGAELYAPGGRLLEADEVLRQPGLVEALEVVAREGAGSVYRGTIAEALLAVPGVVVTRGDLAAYEARWSEPVEVAYAGTRFLTRRGLSGVPELLARLPRLAGLSPRNACWPSWTCSTTEAPRGIRRTCASWIRRAAPSCSRRAWASAPVTSSPASTST